MIQHEILTKERVPDTIDELKTLVISQQEQLKSLLDSYKAETEILREKIQLLQNQLYGRKSEKISLDIEDGFAQTSLFDEVEDLAKPVSTEPEKVEEITVPSHKRKKRGRQALPASLPRTEIIHDISEKEKQCGCGSQMSCIGEEVSERLAIRPASMWVERNVRPKYACKHCEGVERQEGTGSVKIAPVPAQLLPKTIATPSLLSHIFVGKFCDALPFYRQERQFRCFNISLSRATMCNWAIKVAMRCKRLVELLHQTLLSGPLINMDETPVQVLREPGRRASNKSYMWVARGGPPGQEVAFYHYDPSRSSRVVSYILGDYRGRVQTDGYSSYNFLDNRKGIIHGVCWAHVRRKFHNVLILRGFKGNVDKVRNLQSLGKAGEAMQFIRDLYDIERGARKLELSPELVYEARQIYSKPIADEFKSWLDELAPRTPGKNSLGEAIRYTLGQWPRLIKYLDDSIMGMDNNLAENAIRPFVIGRKNWLFFEQPEGAEAGAALYSLIETAKANKLEPYKYLCYLFDKLAHIPVDSNDDEKLKTLLPINLSPDILEAY